MKDRTSLPAERRARLEQIAKRALDAVARCFPRRRRQRVTFALPEKPRIAILLQWGIGDAVMTLPLLTGLRSALPDARIELLGKAWLDELFRGTGLYDATHALVPPWTGQTGKCRIGRGAWRRYFAELWSVRRHRFDLVVSCRYDARDVLQLKLLRSGARVAYGAAGGARWLDLDLGAPPSRTTNAPVHRDAAHALFEITGRKAPSLPALPRDDARAKAALLRLREAGLERRPVVVVSPSAGHPIRKWDPDKLRNVLARSASRIGFLVVVQDPADPGPPDVRIPAGVKGMVWSGSLTELRGLFLAADVTLCCDSGVMHMASASGCRVVAIFGPGSPDWYGPYGSEDRVVIQQPMPCRPCFDTCIYPEAICMTAISEDMVEAALGRALQPDHLPVRREF
jgi:ADP-heptose:LPS heptosyltransferase